MMKLKTATKILIKEVEFLGLKNLGELVNDIYANPLAYPLKVLEAHQVYKELAYK